MLTYTYCLPAIVNVLKVIKLNKPITPAEINKADGSRNYAAKYVMLMRKYYGFTFTVQKDGRTVVSYTCTAMPENVKELRNYKVKTKKVAVEKVEKVKVEKKAVIISTIGEERRRIRAAEERDRIKSTARKMKIDPVEKMIGSSGEIASSFAVDNEWDSIDNVMDLLRG